MSNEPNKPIPAQELTEKELEGVSGGGIEVAAVRTSTEVLLRKVVGASEMIEGDALVGYSSAKECQGLVFEYH